MMKNKDKIKNKYRLPDEIFYEIGAFLENNDLALMCLVSKPFMRLFSRCLYKRLNMEKSICEGILSAKPKEIDVLNRFNDIIGFLVRDKYVENRHKDHLVHLKKEIKRILKKEIEHIDFVMNNSHKLCECEDEDAVKRSKSLINKFISTEAQLIKLYTENKMRCFVNFNEKNNNEEDIANTISNFVFKLITSDLYKMSMTQHLYSEIYMPNKRQMREKINYQRKLENVIGVYKSAITYCQEINSNISRGDIRRSRLHTISATLDELKKYLPEIMKEYNNEEKFNYLCSGDKNCDCTRQLYFALSCCVLALSPPLILGVLNFLLWLFDDIIDFWTSGYCVNLIGIGGGCLVITLGVLLCTACCICSNIINICCEFSRYKKDINKLRSLKHIVNKLYDLAKPKDEIVIEIDKVKKGLISRDETDNIIDSDRKVSKNKLARQAKPKDEIVIEIDKVKKGLISSDETDNTTDSDEEELIKVDDGDLNEINKNHQETDDTTKNKKLFTRRYGFFAKSTSTTAGRESLLSSESIKKNAKYDTP